MNHRDSNPNLLMSWEEWMQYDALGLAELLRSKEATPREVASQVAAGIAKVNPAINAVIELFDDVVDEPLRDGMNPDGFFAGVPFLIKDLGPTLKGRKQEMGSLLMQGNVSSDDSFLTTKIRGAGLNIVGRTTTPEFGMGVSAENPALYISKNPWNLAYTTGGSSSGAGAIVASGAIPISHASDGGGSTRIPASVNGTIGLKPSRGVLSAAPTGSDLISLTSVNSCISRSVRDTAAFVDSCRGAAAGEFMTFWLPEEPSLEMIKRDPPKLKIAISHEWGDYRASPHIASELERVGRFFEGLGHQVEWRTPDIDYRAIDVVSKANSIARFSRQLERLVALRGHAKPTVALVEPLNVKIWEAGTAERVDVQEQIPLTYNKVSRALGQFFENWDVLLTPVTGQPTHKLGTLEFLTLNGDISVDQWFSNVRGLYPYLVIANLCGIPGISLPMAMHENGLPLGIHALSRQANDGLLLQLASQVERALEGKWNEGRRPATHVANA
ncbi:amidase [Bradyrhizobium sp. Gha]|uniref:amidase n=1 Tax=Bradyrhizobium sp. Gha TaxID=1855318 RepID=UPI0008DF037B|nr:amidase [Bradyrhizobium sp. Gha]SFK14268.1 amidase/6-aminohexanoate-cyclic-dimer hydrolase [Bradyrhizobium sp. Gha]